ncbi:MAG: hypothetical protein AAGU75_22020 [Bacillota bacterium]
MAFSGKGIYKGASWKVVPLGHHRWLRCGRWVFPYFVGERVKFKFIVEPTQDIQLNDFPLFVSSHSKKGEKTCLNQQQEHNQN